jgi:hypothetical protein
MPMSAASRKALDDKIKRELIRALENQLERDRANLGRPDISDAAAEAVRSTMRRREQRLEVIKQELENSNRQPRG